MTNNNLTNSNSFDQNNSFPLPSSKKLKSIHNSPDKSTLSSINNNNNNNNNNNISQKPTSSSSSTSSSIFKLPNNNNKSRSNLNRTSIDRDSMSIENNDLRSVEDSIKLELKNRMLISGEWLKLSKTLRDRLKGSKWEEDLRCKAENRALENDHPNLHTLIEYLRPIAQDSIPADLKDEISSSIKSFVESNLELNSSE